MSGRLQVGTIVTSAQNKALELFHSRDTRALHQYLEHWRNKNEKVGVDYILNVVAHFNLLSDNSIRPDLLLGRLRLKFCDHRAYWDGVDVDLTLTEFKVVKAL